MRLTVFSDYALRALIYLEAQQKPVSLRQIASAYGASHNHLVKVVGLLQKAGFVETKRGPGGGVTLARPAEEINLGDVLCATEPDFAIVECLDMATNTCPIAGLCALTGVLRGAKDSFLEEVSRHTLADVTKNRRPIARVLQAREATASGEAPARTARARATRGRERLI